MYDITWQFGNYLMGIFGAFMLFAVLVLLAWIIWVFAHRAYKYLQEGTMPTFGDVLQVLFAGFLIYALAIANANAPKLKIEVPTRAIERTVPNDDEIINLAPKVQTEAEREADQRNLDAETDNRTINK